MAADPQRHVDDCNDIKFRTKQPTFYTYPEAFQK